MIDKKLREDLEQYGIENDYEIILFESPSFDESFIGLSDGHAVYSLKSMIEELMRDEDMSYEDAVEFIEYNTVRSLGYVDNGPIIVDTMRDDIW